MFPANVIQQAERDAEAARRANPDRNVFQRAQDFLRERLAKMTAKPDNKPLTSQQQTQADADAAERYSRKLQKSKNVKRLTNIRKAGTNIPLSGLGLVLGAGGLIGKFMEDNFEVFDGGSGKGDGRAAFKASPDPKPIYGTLPPSARVVTDYPEGVSTGVGGGNAAQAQSVDPKESAYIPPTTQTPVETITPAPTAPVNTGTEIETLVKQTTSKKPYSVFDDPRFMSARDRAQKRIKDVNQERREYTVNKKYGEYAGMTPQETELFLQGSVSPIEN